MTLLSPPPPLNFLQTSNLLNFSLFIDLYKNVWWEQYCSI